VATVTHENKTDLTLAADGTIAKCMDGCRVCGIRGPAPVPARLNTVLAASAAAIMAKVADIDARTTAVAVQSQKLAADRMREMLVAKASATYVNTGNAGDVGDLLFDLGQADAAGIGMGAGSSGLLQRFEAILKAADAALGRGSHSTDTAAASAAAASSNAAYSQLVGKAQALQNKDPELSEAQAISKAATLNPGLVRQWQRDNNAGGGVVRI
jgi:hypothetical protein